MKWVQNNALYLAWTLSLAGMLLSLFVSEIGRLEPCHLCWYQRIALFPLTLFLGMAVYKNDLSMIPYAAPLVAVGGLVALYQTVGQRIPYILSSGTCGFAEECTASAFSFFGFITFPFLSMLGFSAIGFFLWLAKKRGS